MKSQIRHHAEEILRLLDTEEEPEKPVDEPIEDKSDDVWTIEQHPNTKSLDGNTYPAGTPINFAFSLRKNGKPARGEGVIIETPERNYNVTTDHNGNAGVMAIVNPIGGMTIRAKAKGLVAETRIEQKGGSLPKKEEPTQPKDGGELPPVEEPESEHTDHRFDADGRKIHPLGYVPEKPVYNVQDVSVPNGNISVGVVFLAKNFALSPRTRVKINNHQYDFRKRSDFDFKVHQAGGFIINLPEKLVRVAVHPLDVWNKDFGNHGYMNFSWKVLPKHPDYDFQNILTGKQNKDHLNYWAGGYGGGRMFLRQQWNGTWKPNPRFWEYNLADHGNVGQYNKTNKFLVIIGNPKDWVEVNDRNEWHPIP